MQAKLDELNRILRRHAPLLIAYSGGVDSAFLLAAARRALGERVTGAIADSPSLPRQALADALALAESVGAAVEVVRTEELANQDYASNPGSPPSPTARTPTTPGRCGPGSRRRRNLPWWPRSRRRV